MSPIIRFIALGFAMIAPQLCFGGLVPGGGDLENDLNNALRFDPSTPTNVIVAYKDPNVPLDRYIQVGYRTTNSTPLSITSIG